MKSPLCCFLIVIGLATPARADEQVDLSVVHRIKQEAFAGSKVMDHLFFLTDVNGPRLTNSPGERSAADWAVRSLKEWGIPGARIEGSGTFARGWSLRRFSMSLKQPVYAPISGIPLAWSGDTRGAATGEVVFAPLYAEEGMERRESDNLPELSERIRRYAEENKGKLKGKVVLFTTPRELELPAKAASERLDKESLDRIARAPEPLPQPDITWPITNLPDDPKKRRKLFGEVPLEIGADMRLSKMRIQDQLNSFLRDEGALAVLVGVSRGDGGIVFTQNRSSYEPGAPIPPPIIALSPEQYGRLCRLVEKKIPVAVEVDVAVSFHEDKPERMNVIAEIPGKTKAGEVVMLGAHLDSWHAGTGATDNAAGTAVMMETMRILMALGSGMDRTVRLALWTGEEQGLQGSRAYVKNHFADPVTMELNAEHAGLSGYFNLDNGTGKIRGVYLQGNDMMRPIFERWFAPFKDMDVTTIAIDDTGGTDHLPFDAVGLPGFQFIQDPLDYSTRTHHTDLDVYDRLQAADLMQASAVIASVVWNAATRPDRLPRKPLPKPLPPRSK